MTRMSATAAKLSTPSHPCEQIHTRPDGTHYLGCPYSAYRRVEGHWYCRTQASADMHEATRTWLVALTLDSDDGATRAYEAWVRACAVYDNINDRYEKEIQK